MEETERFKEWFGGRYPDLDSNFNASSCEILLFADDLSKKHYFFSEWITTAHILASLIRKKKDYTFSKMLLNNRNTLEMWNYLICNFRPLDGTNNLRTLNLYSSRAKMALEKASVVKNIFDSPEISVGHLWAGIASSGAEDRGQQYLERFGISYDSIISQLDRSYNGWGELD